MPRDLHPSERLAVVPREGGVPGPAAGNLSEDFLALQFAATHQHLRYVEIRGKWLRWDGVRWSPDSTGHTFSDVRAMLRSTPAPEDKCRGLLSAKTVAAVERLARVDRRLAATIDQWDGAHWDLNTPSGIVNLRSGELIKHDPEKYHTKLTAAPLGGDCPLWHSFLAHVTGGDDQLAAFLQRLAGYALTGTTREHALFFLYGTGANGKGTFLNTLVGVLGDYAKVASMETFTEMHGERHPADLAALRGARLVIAQETEEGRRWAESRIKAMTGGDPITARFMRQDFFTYQPRFKLLIAGNLKPRLRNVDEAIRRRLHLVPFTVTVPSERRDPDLADKLKEEWPGILRWAVDGCDAYLDEGLSPPAVVIAATDEYFGAQDLFAQWLENCCEIAPEHWENPTRLFTSWTAFAGSNNERPGRQAAFKDRLEAMGFRKDKTFARGHHYVGLRVAPPHPADDLRGGPDAW